MKEIIQKRVVPVSVITVAVFSVLALFQLFVIVGGFETRAATVKRVAPWAYEPFLRLVGEHPDTRPEWSVAGKTVETKSGSSSAMADVVGMDFSEPLIKETPSLEIDALNAEPATVIPVSTPTNPPAAPVDEDIPVG